VFGVNRERIGTNTFISNIVVGQAAASSRHQRRLERIAKRRSFASVDLNTEFIHASVQCNIRKFLTPTMCAVCAAACCRCFLSRDSMPMHAERDIVMTNPSVCPSVCPSHSGIVSKRMHISSNSFYYLVEE